MCLGIPARVRSLAAGHPDLAEVDLAGVPRLINVGLLDEPVAPGDWILVHMGFALSPMTEQEAADALRVFSDEREAQVGP